MSKIEITVNGCDDESTVILELDAQQYKTIELLQKKINELDTRHCTPWIEIRKLLVMPDESED